MVDRPPVKHVGTLPEGNLNGYGVLYGHLLDVEGSEGYVLARVRRTATKHVDATGVDEVHVRITEIEPLVGGKMPTDYDHAGEALQAIRGDRTGEQQIPQDDAAGYARLVELRRQLTAYRDREGITQTTLGKTIIATIPGAEAGWWDDPRIIDEFLRHVDELDQDALNAAGRPPSDQAQEEEDAQVTELATSAPVTDAELGDVPKPIFTG